MKHRLGLPILVCFLWLTTSTFAQTAREATHVVQPGETLERIATQYGVDMSDLASYNGIFNTSRIQSWQELAIPDESYVKEIVAESGNTHIVSYGETLGTIADNYGVSLSDLMYLNDLYNHVIHPGHVLQLPIGDVQAPVIHDISEQVSETVTHIVQYGETLGIIAVAYGVNLGDLMSVNNLYSDVIYPGLALQLPSAASTPTIERVDPATAASRNRHIVQFGETLGTIAISYGVDLNTLVIENGIFSHIIYPGQELVLPAESAVLQDDEPEELEETVTADTPAIVSSSRAFYSVRAGDTLSEIASHFGLTLAAVMQANDIYYPHRIVVGQQLRIPAAGSLSWTVANIEPGWPTDAKPEPVAAVEAEPVAEEEPLPVTAPQPANHFAHTIQFGDSMSTIASHYGISMQELMNTNAITDPNRIAYGQKLWIPDSAASRAVVAQPQTPPSQPVQVDTTPPSNAGREQYIVRSGEFLSQIGNKLGMNWVAIAEVNGLANPDSLHAGMVLLVPNAEDLAKYPASYGGYNSYDLYSNDPGAHLGVGREFVVVLSTQRAYAYENGVLQKAALVSTGLPATPTVQGDYAIYRKRRSQRMTGPDYNLDNVEWVMFFYQGYSFHGTYWHNNFGQPMSHGCVNMTNPDAKWFYEFGSLGTPVHVRYY